MVDISSLMISIPLNRITGASFIADAEDSIQRNGFDVVLKTEILLGDSNGIIWLKQSDVFIQTGCSDMFAAFYFHRDDLTF